MLKRYAIWTLSALAGALFFLYVGDSVALRLKVRSGTAFATMTIHRYYAVPQKSGKLEFLSADPEQQTCTNSLFPQMGHFPCWYVSRHTEQRIDM
jgi:hypothetical protein